MSTDEVKKDDGKRQEMIEKYRRISEDLLDAAKMLHDAWHDGAGEEMYRRAAGLAEEMNENCERLKRCCGSL